MRRNFHAYAVQCNGKMGFEGGDLLRVGFELIIHTYSVGTPQMKFGESSLDLLQEPEFCSTKECQRILRRFARRQERKLHVLSRTETAC